MVIFENITYDTFRKEYGEKKIICFGGGGTLRLFFELQNARLSLLRRIVAIVNHDRVKKNVHIKVQSFTIPVWPIGDYIKRVEHFEDHVMLLLVARESIPEVLQELDGIDAFDQMVCIYGIGSLTWGREMFYPPYPFNARLPLCGQEYEIPKIIHYCWFGGGEMTELHKGCIESWKEHCPDYEIRFWNETNYDISKTPLYVRQAYEAKKYAFVSDYVRLDLVYHFGGFYLDTDVELLRSLDVFLHYRAVFGFMEYGEINTGLGFGCVAGRDAIKELRDMYEACEFINEDGSYNLTPCPIYTNGYFQDKGIRTDNELQLMDDMLFLPSSYFCPLTPIESEDGKYNLTLYSLSADTYAIHQCENTWKSENDREAFEKKKDEYGIINRRLLKDWKRKYGEKVKERR